MPGGASGTDTIGIEQFGAGSGTTLGAAAAGVPQLVLPQGADQFSNAEALVEAGVARSLVGPEAITSESVACAARALLDEGTGAVGRARALAAEIAAMPAPDVVAAQVAQWGPAPVIR